MMCSMRQCVDGDFFFFSGGVKNVELLENYDLFYFFKCEKSWVRLLQVTMMSPLWVSIIVTHNKNVSASCTKKLQYSIQISDGSE